MRTCCWFIVAQTYMCDHRSRRLRLSKSPKLPPLGDLEVQESVLSYPLKLQCSLSVSFPTQATVSLIKILYIESPWKLSGRKRFLGQASWVFFIMNLINDRTNKQTNKKVWTFSVTIQVTQWSYHLIEEGWTQRSSTWREEPAKFVSTTETFFLQQPRVLPMYFQVYHFF